MYGPGRTWPVLTMVLARALRQMRTRAETAGAVARVPEGPACARGCCRCAPGHAARTSGSQSSQVREPREHRRYEVGVVGPDAAQVNSTDEDPVRAGVVLVPDGRRRGQLRAHWTGCWLDWRQEDGLARHRAGRAVRQNAARGAAPGGRLRGRRSVVAAHPITEAARHCSVQHELTGARGCTVAEDECRRPPGAGAPSGEGWGEVEAFGVGTAV